VNAAAVVHGDESRIVQILVNLLTNAAQAFPTPDPERNRVEVSVVAQGDRGRVRVSDNGPGIRPGVEHRVFDPFFTTKPPGKGTGLGLSISRSLAQALGGQLGLEETSATGTTFTLELPRSTVESDGAQRPKPAVAQGPAVRVLVIDDEPSLLTSIVRILGKSHSVSTEVDARRAVERLEAGEQFELILCDVVMPHLTGLDVLRRLQASSPGVAERVVLMSGGALDEQLRGASPSSPTSGSRSPSLPSSCGAWWRALPPPPPPESRVNREPRPHV
jgi:CheY-like chemotaxis protein/anti-sigma regulatory factor (Ser/Thr protein kinase)